MYDPWIDLDSRPEISLGTLKLKHGNGIWYADLGVIVLREGMTPAEQRCVLAHELAHIDNAHIRPDSDHGLGAHIIDRQEAEADRLAAFRLIWLEDLTRVFHLPDDEAAAILCVTPAIYRERVRIHESRLPYQCETPAPVSAGTGVRYGAGAPGVTGSPGVNRARSSPAAAG